ASSITVPETCWSGGSWSTVATGCAVASLATAGPTPTNANANANASAPLKTRMAGKVDVPMGRLLGKAGGERRPVASQGHRVPASPIRLAARHAARGRFDLLDAALQLIQPLVGPLRGLIGRFGTLGRALHPRV